MVEKIKKIWKSRWVMRNIFQTIYFNLHYLPLKQAVHLPRWLYKPRFGKLKGSIVLAGKVRTGLVRLGYFGVDLYPNSGVYIHNEGRIEFSGEALIGNDCYLSVAPSGHVVFGRNFRATAAFRLACYGETTFNENVRFGWDCIVMDTDFHKLTRMDGSQTKGYGEVCIGSNNWFGNGCRIMKRTWTPNYCTIAAGTYLSKAVNVPAYSVIGNRKDVVVIARDAFLDANNADIEYRSSLK